MRPLFSFLNGVPSASSITNLLYSEKQEKNSLILIHHLCNNKWFTDAQAIMHGVQRAICCVLTPSRSLKPHSTALLVNTTPDVWFWLLPSGNGFVLVVS